MTRTTYGYRFKRWDIVKVHDGWSVYAPTDYHLGKHYTTLCPTIRLAEDYIRHQGQSLASIFSRSVRDRQPETTHQPLVGTLAGAEIHVHQQITDEGGAQCQ
jgi:hypothetical protein